MTARGHFGLIMAVSGGGGGAAHRYWRLRITAPDGSASYMGASEVAFLNDHGDPFNIPTGATAAMFGSSILNGGNSIAQAFDRVANSGWLSATAATPQHVGFDFQGTGASPSAPVAVRGIRIYGSHNIPTSSPKDFDVQWSDDGVTYTTHFSVTGSTGWAAQEAREFFDPAWTGIPVTAPPGGGAEYWRVLVRKVQGAAPQAVSIGEIEMRATVGGADQCSGGTASASSVFGTLVAANAFDNNNTTRWGSLTYIPAWVQYQFAAPVSVGQLLVRSPDAGNYASGQMPREFQLQWSTNGTDFFNAFVAPTQTSAWSASTDNLFTI